MLLKLFGCNYKSVRNKKMHQSTCNSYQSVYEKPSIWPPPGYKLCLRIKGFIYSQ